ncbi:MAG: hypothetical protein EPO12_02235 [Aquabacterium sp.]|jgi:hypothetical protein|nr:MAG: hypothetical protein EPO12_02235 [Aquabacterium sp.]
MVDRTRLIDSVKLLDSPEKLSAIGSEIVKEAIARAIVRKAKTGHVSNGMSIRKGEYVPEGIRRAINVKVDAAGHALQDWPGAGIAAATGDYFEVCYEDSDAGYCECWPDAADFKERITSISNSRLERLAGVTRAELDKHFSKAEIAALAKHGLVRR